MGINFPSSPLVGDLWPNPAVAGQGQYTWDGEKWTAGATPASRASIYAAPFDALAYNGIQINGSFQISQERGITNPVTAQSAFIMDGWRLLYVTTGSAVVNAQQAGPVFGGAPNCLLIGTTAAQTTIGANDYVGFFQSVEAYRMLRLAWGNVSAQPITIGFWTAHTKPGLYGVAIRAAGNVRSCVMTYTQAVTGVWQYNVVTFPGDAAGAYPVDNTTGMTITFTVAGGSALQAPATGTWYATTNPGYVTAAGQVNGVDNTSNVFRITNVVVLPGIETPSAARSPLIMRPFDQELVTCQRYYQKSYPYGTAPGTAMAASNSGEYWDVVPSTPVSITSRFNCRMRSAPTVNAWDNAGALNKVSYYISGVWNNGQALSFAGVDDFSFRIGTSSPAGAQLINYHWVADIRL